MGLLQVKRCLCCFSLRTGVQIILWMTLIGAFLELFPNPQLYLLQTLLRGHWLAFFADSHTIFVRVIVAIVVSVSGLHAIDKRKPSRLIPYLFYHTLSCILMVGAAVVVPLYWSSFRLDEVLDEMVNGDVHMTDEGKKEFYDFMHKLWSEVIFPLSEIILILGAVLYTYLLLVVYSYYKVMVDELRNGVLFQVPAAIENMSNKEYVSNLYRDWKTDETTMAFSPPPPYTPSNENGPYPYKI